MKVGFKLTSGNDCVSTIEVVYVNTDGYSTDLLFNYNLENDLGFW